MASMTKKVTVITSSMLLSFAIYEIFVDGLKIQGKLPREGKYYDPYAVGVIIVFLLVALATSESIFNAMPAKVTRIWLVAVSILSPIMVILLFLMVLLDPKEGFDLFSGDGSFLFIALCLGLLVVIVTSVTNIRRALKPTKTQEGKAE